MIQHTFTPSIKTVIVDDNRQVRYLVKEILQDEKDIEVCAEAETLEEAGLILTRWHPDIAIFDILLDEYKGDIFLREISRYSRITKVIILSAHSEAHYAETCLQAGARGYVCKGRAIPWLAAAIRDVHAGKIFVSSSVSV